MRVAVFSDIYRPRIGGTSVSVTATFSALKAENVMTLLFAPSPHSGAREPGTVFFPTIPFRLGGTNIRTALPYAKRVDTQFSHFDPQVVHSFSPFVVGNRAKALSHKHKKPVLFTYQTRYDWYVHFLSFGYSALNHAYVKRLLSSSVRSWTIRVCNSFDHIVVPTDTIADHLKHLGVRTDISIIPVGPNLTSPSGDTNPIRDRYKISHSKFLMTHVGRLSSEKNIRFLLEAAGIVLSQFGEKAHLMIIGEGPERVQLERQSHMLNLEDRVTFVGPVPHEQVSTYLHAADCFVFSSLSDTQAFVVCEALVCGLPVVALRAPGPADFITAGEEGFLTDHDHYAFAQAIITLMNNSVLRDRIGLKAQQKGRLFSTEQYAHSLINLYERLSVSLHRHI